MTIGCNIWMICLILIWFFYGLRRMFQLPQFVWALRSSVWDIFINFLLIDATDRSKISSDQKRFFIALCLYPLLFFANTPFNIVFWYWCPHKYLNIATTCRRLCSLEIASNYVDNLFQWFYRGVINQNDGINMKLACKIKPLRIQLRAKKKEYNWWY